MSKTIGEVLDLADGESERRNTTTPFIKLESKPMLITDHIQRLAPTGELYLSVAALMEAGLTEQYINSATSRGIFPFVKDSKDKRKTWIHYDSLPKPTRAKVDERYPNIYQYTAITEKTEAAWALIEPDDAVYFGQQQPKKNGGAYTRDEIQALTKACGWLRLIDREDKAKTYTIHISKEQVVKGRTAYFQWLAEACIKPLDLYGFKVGNGRILDKRLTAWRESGYESLVSRYFGNDNRESFKEYNDIEGNNVVRDFLLREYGTNKKPVAMLARLVRDEFGVSTTRQALTIWLNKPEIQRIWEAMREGKVVTREKNKTTLRTLRPDFADAQWLIDTTAIALMCKTDDGKSFRKAPWSRCVVMDAYSGAFIGVYYAETENTKMVLAAVRKAIANTGHLPHSIKYDGGSANVSKETQAVFEAISIYHFPTQAHAPTGKARVEKAQDLLESQHLQAYDNFSGGNITRRGTQKTANVDTIQRLWKSGNMPDKWAVLQQDLAAVRKYNQEVGADGKSRIERYQESQHEKRRKAILSIVSEAFWVKRERTIRYGGGGFDMQIGGQRIGYWVGKDGNPMIHDDSFKLKHLGESFTVRWNPDDPSVIALYHAKDDRFIAAAQQAHVFNSLPDMSSPEEIKARLLNKQLDKSFFAEGEAQFRAVELRLEQKGIPRYNHYLDKVEDKQLEEAVILEQLTAIPAPSVPTPKKMNLFKEFAKTGN